MTLNSRYISPHFIDQFDRINRGEKPDYSKYNYLDSFESSSGDKNRSIVFSLPNNQDNNSLQDDKKTVGYYNLSSEFIEYLRKKKEINDYYRKLEDERNKEIERKLKESYSINIIEHNDEDKYNDDLWYKQQKKINDNFHKETQNIYNQRASYNSNTSTKLQTSSKMQLLRDIKEGKIDFQRSPKLSQNNSQLSQNNSKYSLPRHSAPFSAAEIFSELR